MPRPTFDDPGDTDVAFWGGTPKGIADPLVRPSVAIRELTALGIDCSTPATLFDAMDARRLFFEVRGPFKFHAKVFRLDERLPGPLEIAHGTALTMIGALAVVLYLGLRDYPEYLPVERQPRRYLRD